MFVSILRLIHLEMNDFMSAFVQNVMRNSIIDVKKRGEACSMLNITEKNIGCKIFR